MMNLVHLAVEDSQVFHHSDSGVCVGRSVGRSFTEMSRLTLYKDMITDFRESYGSGKRVSSVSVVIRLGMKSRGIDSVPDRDTRFLSLPNRPDRSGARRG